MRDRSALALTARIALVCVAARSCGGVEFARADDAGPALAVLTGRVIRSDGPAAGATVEVRTPVEASFGHPRAAGFGALADEARLLWPDVESRAPVATAVTAADGTFRIPGVPAGRYDVFALAADGVLSKPSSVRAGVGTTDLGLLWMPREGVSVRGRAAYVSKAPFLGAVIATLTRRPSDGIAATPRASVVTFPDAMGRFEFRGLPAVPDLVSFAVPGVSRRFVFTEGFDPTRLDVCVDSLLSRMEGRIVALAEAPEAVRGALVISGDFEFACWHFAGAIYASTTDGDGRFAAPRGGLTYFAASAPTFAVRASPADLSPRGTLALPHLRRVSGRVTSRADGAPLRATTVNFRLLDERSGPLDHVPPTRTTTDAAGRYALDLDPSISGTLEIHGGGWAAAAPATVAAGSTEAALDLVAVPPRTIRVRVLDPSGNPSAGAIVRARSRAAIAAAADLEDDRADDEMLDAAVAASGADGVAVVRGVSRRVPQVIDVEAPGLFAPAPVEVPASDQDRDDAEVRLIRRVAWTVVARSSGDAAPLAGVEVSATAAGVPGWQGLAWTGADGTAAFVAPATELAIRASRRAGGEFLYVDDVRVGTPHPDVREAGITLRFGVASSGAEAPVGVEVLPPVRDTSIEGRLLDSRGIPAFLVRIRLCREDDPASSRYVVPQFVGARFRVEGLAPGRYRVTAVAGDPRSKDVDSEEVVVEAGATDVVLRLRPSRAPPAPSGPAVPSVPK